MSENYFADFFLYAREFSRRAASMSEISNVGKSLNQITSRTSYLSSSSWLEGLELKKSWDIFDFRQKNSGF